MRKFILLFIFFSNKLISQQNSYEINAVFDINNSIISLDQKLTYVNNSGKELDYLILNDWAHSYSSSSSNLGKRLSEEYILSFQRSTKNQRGYTEIRTIFSNNDLLSYSRLPNQIDLIKVELREPLKSNETIELNNNYNMNEIKELTIN